MIFVEKPSPRGRVQGGKAKDVAAELQPPNGEAPFLQKISGLRAGSCSLCREEVARVSLQRCSWGWCQLGALHIADKALNEAWRRTAALPGDPGRLFVETPAVSVKIAIRSHSLLWGFLLVPVSPA